MLSGQSPRRLVYISNAEKTASDRTLLNPLRLLHSSRIEVTGTALCFPREADAIRQAANMRDSADAIILGGGVFGNAILDDYIEFWRAARVPLILWGGGLSGRDNASLSSATLPQLEDYHQLAGFTLIGLRDYELGFRWVPCSSCMDPLFDKNSDLGHGSVLALQRKSRAMPEFENGIREGDPQIPVVYDDASFDVLIGTLRQAEFVITNSYSAAYWSTLLGKRVVAIEGDVTMTMSKHPPVVANTLDWPSSLDQSWSYPHALEECRQATLDFRSEVSELVFRPGALKPYNRDPVAEHAKHTPAPILTPSQNLAPRIVHFIFGLAADFGGKPFNVMHQIAILSAIDQIKPEQVFFYYRHLPSGALFDSVKSSMTLVALPPADDQMPVHFAHQSDAIRLQKLHESGGIYLDLDTITLGSFDPLLAYCFTIGVQGLSRIDGLCNAVMIAKPRSSFIQSWLDAYSRFTDQWDRFSVRLPYVMWRTGRWDIHVEPFDSFHWPTWRAGGLSALFERDFVFPNARCHHLWESQSYPRYFSGKTDAQIVAEISRGNSTYSRLARRYVSWESEVRF